MSGDMVAWLRECIVERLETAKLAPGQEWREDTENHDILTEANVCVAGTDLVEFTWPDQRSPVLAHIAANDPRQVIADCEADLAILDDHGQLNDSIWCRRCDPATDDLHDEHVWYPCRTVRLVASRYRHQAGYEKHWGGDG